MRRLVFVVLVGVAVACSSTQGGGSTSGAVTPEADAGLDGNADVDADAGLDGNADADADAGPPTCVTAAGPGLPCAASVATFCKGTDYQFPYGACGETWQSAIARDPCSWIVPNDMGPRVETCDPLHVMAFDGDDGGTEYFFDASGALVAVVMIADPGVYTCAAGPACFVAPACTVFGSFSCAGGGPQDAAGADVRDAGGQ